MDPLGRTTSSLTTAIDLLIYRIDGPAVNFFRCPSWRTCSPLVLLFREKNDYKCGCNCVEQLQYLNSYWELVIWFSARLFDGDLETFNDMDTSEFIEPHSAGVAADNSCIIRFIEIVPLNTDGPCTTECDNGDWSAEVDEEILQHIKQEPDDVPVHVNLNLTCLY